MGKFNRKTTDSSKEYIINGSKYLSIICSATNATTFQKEYPDAINDSDKLIELASQLVVYSGQNPDHKLDWSEDVDLTVARAIVDDFFYFTKGIIKPPSDSLIESIMNDPAKFESIIGLLSGQKK